MRRYVAAWLVHLLTASGAVVALFSLLAITMGQWNAAFVLMALAVVIDSIDGALARWAQVNVYANQLDGALLDNIVDYLNYVFVPATFVIFHPTLISGSWKLPVACAILLTSAYQFCQRDAKTEDHFFKGFPSYWNLAVYYLIVFNTSASTNCLVLLGLGVLVFVPIKYLYMSRMTHVTENILLSLSIKCAIGLYAVASVVLLVVHEGALWQLARCAVAGMILCYVGMSVYRTFRPLVLLTQAGRGRRCDSKPGEGIPAGEAQDFPHPRPKTDGPSPDQRPSEGNRRQNDLLSFLSQLCRFLRIKLGR